MKFLVSERNIDILCVSETFLLPYTPDEYVNIPNYMIFRCDDGRGEGACIYVSDSLNRIPVVINNPKKLGVEDVWVTAQSKKWPSIIIGCIYRHPKAPAASFDYIQNALRAVILRKKNILVLGDVNDDLLSINNKLSRILKNNKPTQVIDKPTRVTRTSATLLDVAITNDNNIIATHDFLPQVIADHDLISVTVNVTKPKRQPVKRTFCHLGGYCQFKLCSLFHENFHAMNNILFTDDVNKQVELFTEVFIKCLDACSPIVSKEIKRSFAPWVNDNLRRAMKIRNNAQRKLKADRHNSRLQDAYKKEKKSVRTLISKTKADYYHAQINNC